VISYFELLSGARRPRERDAISALLESITILPLDVSAARRAAEVRQRLEGSGVGIGMGDSLIAGIALDAEAKLLTRNRRHFDRVPGLHLVGAGV
jgi:tRNA(fMet)-specific endonuclease VapC